MDTQKQRISGIVGTTLFHVLLLIFLLIYKMSYSANDILSTELEGVPVMFGNVPDAFGDDEPFGRGSGTEVDASVEESPMVAPTEQVSIPKESSSPKTPDKATNTQDFEQTVAVKVDKVAEEKKRQDKIAAEQKRREEAEAQRIAQAQAEKQKNINSQMSGLFGNGSGSGSRGNTTGAGTQGVPTGNASHGKTTGIGGNGTYDLGGRSVGAGGLAQPSYSVDDYGTVVVDITVDPKGNVVEATVGKRTNTTNSTLLNEALRAARRTKFNVVSTLGNQKGTITYKFNLN